MRDYIVNPGGQKQLEKFAKELQKYIDNGIDIQVELIYRDMGAGEKHYTIVASTEDDLSGFQVLNPNQMKQIEENDYDEMLVKKISDKINSILS